MYVAKNFRCFKNSPSTGISQRAWSSESLQGLSELRNHACAARLVLARCPCTRGYVQIFVLETRQDAKRCRHLTRRNTCVTSIGPWKLPDLNSHVTCQLYFILRLTVAQLVKVFRSLREDTGLHL
jgi:hypothetical protein